jgi:hypothetical protein
MYFNVLIRDLVINQLRMNWLLPMLVVFFLIGTSPRHLQSETSVAMK